MNKIDRTVLRETAYIALCVTAMTAVVCLVFLLIGKWSTSVLLGGLLGTAVSVLNFFLMGVTVQSAVGMDDKSMHRRVRVSWLLRMLLVAGVVVLGALVPCFNVISTILPLFLLKIALFIRPLFGHTD